VYIDTPWTFCRDWRGLAQLVGLSGQMVALIGVKSDPTAQVLSHWRQGSLGILRSILGQLDRWDVVDDTEDMMSERQFYTFIKILNMK
jgi:Death domain.